MPAPKFVKNFIQYMFNNYSKDDGKLLVHMGALGWVFSSAAQLVMLMTDKKIDKDKKKFLLPQEAADAGANVILYYTICEVIKKGSDYFVEKGKILTSDVVEAFSQIKSKTFAGVDPKNWKSIFTAAELKGNNLTALLEDPSKLNIFKGHTADEIKAFKPAVEKALETLNTHKNNMGIVAAIGASVLACNIVTPIVRNAVGAKFQKHLIKKEAVEKRKMQIKDNITMKSPLPSCFKSFSNYNSFGNIKI